MSHHHRCCRREEEERRRRPMCFVPMTPCSPEMFGSDPDPEGMFMGPEFRRERFRPVCRVVCRFPFR